jgi:NAD(P)H-dependent flavin oxidoreductase YrpB (nitropropane dioxygenase family)
MLGIERPIVQAPMAAIPRLAAAVSNAGALGMVTLTWSDDAGAVVRQTAALTARPFGGNLVLTEDHHRRLDQALQAGLRIVSFMWGDPSGYIEPVHDAGGIVMLTVGSAEEARRAVASGVDVIVAQGWEAGGHVWSTVATLPLVPAVVDAVAPVPVIAAGGIGDARGVAAVLALGAQAAWLGTRFLLAEEMPIHEDYRRALIAAAASPAACPPAAAPAGGSAPMSSVTTRPGRPTRSATPTSSPKDSAPSAPANASASSPTPPTPATPPTSSASTSPTSRTTTNDPGERRLVTTCDVLCMGRCVGIAGKVKTYRGHHDQTTRGRPGDGRHCISCSLRQEESLLAALPVMPM